VKRFVGHALYLFERGIICSSVWAATFDLHPIVGGVSGLDSGLGGATESLLHFGRKYRDRLEWMFIPFWAEIYGLDSTWILFNFFLLWLVFWGLNSVLS